MKSLKKTVAALVLAAMMAALLPAGVFAAGSVKLTVENDLYVLQGAEAYVDISAQADAGTSYRLVLSSPDSSIEITNGNSGILTGNQKSTLSYKVANSAATGFRTLTLKAVDSADSTAVLSTYNVYINVVENKNSYSSLSKIDFDLTYSITGGDSLQTGDLNNLKLGIFNRASDVSNARVSITLPAGLSIKLGATSRSIGAMSYGKTYNVDYPIVVSPDTPSGSYPITVTVTGTVVNNNTASELTATETVYVPVSGKGISGDDGSSPLLVVDKFSAGGTVASGKDFIFNVDFKNIGTKEIKSAKIVVAGEGGSAYSAQGSVYLNNIAAGATVSQSISMKAANSLSGPVLPVTVTMAYRDANGKEYTNTDTVNLSVSGAGGADGSVVNPILMVSDYSYGGASVLAGSEFSLVLTVSNTSGKTLRNIKMVVTDSAGVIIPAKGSNSSFIPSISANSSVSKTLHMSVNRSTELTMDSLTVNMSYEDEKGGTFSSADVISIPIRQNDRLVVDDILDPGSLMAGQQGYFSVNYYNMGKTVLSNLRISVSGESFTLEGGGSSYIGNMNPGRSDYYNVTFTPQSAGLCTGKVTFTFENTAGVEQVLEKDFSFEVMEMPVDPGFPEGPDTPAPDAPGMSPWLKLGIGVAAAAAVIIAVVFIKKHRKNKAEALDLDE